MKWIGWLLLVGLSPVAHATPLKLAAAVEHTAILRPFIHDWFGRAGIDFQLIPCTYARCEKLIESVNAVDGDMARIKGFDQTHPHLLQVGAPLSEAAIYGQPRDNPSWPPAKGAVIGCLRGNQWCERNLGSYQVIWLNDEKQGLAQLHRGKVDWVIKMRAAYQPALAAPWQKIAKELVFLYLDKKHRADIAALLKVQLVLINNGRWLAMQKQYLSAI
ncbi:hypothetical protein [Aeromonas sp.]|uniref:hypothetical protein n=1 Tax=Aeromonas sp. TaxID=647 RepID=UPI002586371D|nr:hypothetical protein [Aeromonas sp.]MCX7130285.1 hypothetical protein [Aeromonas sp.]